MIKYFWIIQYKLESIFYYNLFINKDKWVNCKKEFPTGYFKPFEPGIIHYFNILALIIYGSINFIVYYPNSSYDWLNNLIIVTGIVYTLFIFSESKKFPFS